MTEGNDDCMSFSISFSKKSVFWKAFPYLMTPLDPRDISWHPYIFRNIDCNTIILRVLNTLTLTLFLSPQVATWINSCQVRHSRNSPFLVQRHFDLQCSSKRPRAFHCQPTGLI